MWTAEGRCPPQSTWLYRIEKFLFDDLAVLHRVNPDFIHLEALPLLRPGFCRDVVVELDGEAIVVRERPFDLRRMDLMVFVPPMILPFDLVDAAHLGGHLRTGHRLDADDVLAVQRIDGLQILPL